MKIKSSFLSFVFEFFMVLCLPNRKEVPSIKYMDEYEKLSDLANPKKPSWVYLMQNINLYLQLMCFQWWTDWFFCGHHTRVKSRCEFIHGVWCKLMLNFLHSKTAFFYKPSFALYGQFSLDFWTRWWRLICACQVLIYHTLIDHDLDSRACLYLRQFCFVRIQLSVIYLKHLHIMQFGPRSTYD